MFSKNCENLKTYLSANSVNMSQELVNVAIPTVKPTSWHSQYPILCLTQQSPQLKARNTQLRLSKIVSDNCQQQAKKHKHRRILWHLLKEPYLEWDKIKQGCSFTNNLERKLVCTCLCLL